MVATETEGPPVVARGRAIEVFLVALRLGLTSFGGPIAHLGYFHAEYVQRRRWISEAIYADLVALSHFTPGPASSKLGIAIGTMRAGIPGGILAWAGFTLPSALALVLFALALQASGVPAETGWVHGLKLAAVAVVAQAVWTMARSLAPDRERGTIAVLAAMVVLLVPQAWVQIAVIVVAGVVGRIWLRAPFQASTVRESVPLPRRFAGGCLALFFGLLVALPLGAALADGTLGLIDVFYRVGSLVFGGGHVVLPLLEAEVVPRGWLSRDVFLAGYGAAQAVPGPLFTFAAYLGALRVPEPHGWPGAAVALLAIFLPAFLLMWGTLPLWERLRGAPRARAALMGVNAAVVGILAAALYSPLFTTSVRTPIDAVIVLVAFGALTLWKAPPWLVVLACAASAAGVQGPGAPPIG